MSATWRHTAWDGNYSDEHSDDDYTDQDDYTLTATTLAQSMMTNGWRTTIVAEIQVQITAGRKTTMLSI